MNERRYGVWLYRQHVGTLSQRDDYTWFRFSDDYLSDPNRSVLGLTFEENLTAPYASQLRLPPWFSNLLPEGRLREWIARDRDVSVDREMELLAQVGRDLPGAVQVLEEDLEPEAFEGILAARPSLSVEGNSLDEKTKWRFSLAGVGLKFSMIRAGDRLTLPAYGEGGDWIVKLPDPLFKDVPRNEHAMMSLAQQVGIDIPENLLVHRNQLENLPENVWQSGEEYAYAVRRFDRAANRELIHIEDLAQVRDVYPYNGGKYQGNFETVASLAYRGRDLNALQEVARRLAFNVLISNGDAHLKNWSMIYRDRRSPTLSPAYDLVSTEFYREAGQVEDLGLKFGGSRRFDLVTLGTFDRLESKLGAHGAGLLNCANETVERIMDLWPGLEHLLESNPSMQECISRGIATRRATMQRS